MTGTQGCFFRLYVFAEQVSEGDAEESNGEGDAEESNGEGGGEESNGEGGGNVTEDSSSGSESPSSSDSDSEDIEAELDEEADAEFAGPVYEGARLTVAAMCVALLRFGGKNKHSYAAMKDLFNMQRTFSLPEGNRLPTYARSRKLLVRLVRKRLKSVLDPPVYESCRCGKTCYRNPPIRFDPTLERQFADLSACLFCGAPRYSYDN